MNTILKFLKRHTRNMTNTLRKEWKAIYFIIWFISNTMNTVSQPPAPPNDHLRESDYPMNGGGAPLEDDILLWLIPLSVYLLYQLISQKREIMVIRSKKRS